MSKDNKKSIKEIIDKLEKYKNKSIQDNKEIYFQKIRFYMKELEKLGVDITKYTNQINKSEQDIEQSLKNIKDSAKNSLKDSVKDFFDEVQKRIK